MDAAEIAARILAAAGDRQRFMVAIAGPPAAGKSTLAARLVGLLPVAAAVPMDGFHYDDRVLERLGLRHCKGAPETFDSDGFDVLLQRIRTGGRDVAIPLFDRDLELSRAAADVVAADARFVVCEGNYLLLDEPPWNDLSRHFDFTIFLEVPRAELEQRLARRWRQHGRPDNEARHWIDSNDLPNVDRVFERQLPADLVVRLEPLPAAEAAP